jgi:HD-like signal output (HDOD) protein
MRQHGIKQVLATIEGLPTLPDTLARMNVLVSDPDTTARQVGQLIASDPPIAAKTLKVVNSPFYGFPTRITTITHAIVILGFSTVRSLVLSSSILQAFGDKSCRMCTKSFWKHCVATGAAAKVLAQTLRYLALEEFFIAGLLHDVGKIVICGYLEEEFREIERLVNEKNILMYDAEEEILHGVTHADIAGALFEQWNLPKGLVKSVTYHHTPSLAGDERRITSILHMADVLARALMRGNPGDRRIPTVDPQAWDDTGINPRELDRLLPAIDKEAEKASVFLEMV